jgi:hypothetical protein
MLRVFLVLFLRRHDVRAGKVHESLFDGTAEVSLPGGLLVQGQTRLCGAVR